MASSSMSRICTRVSLMPGKVAPAGDFDPQRGSLARLFPALGYISRARARLVPTFRLADWSRFLVMLPSLLPPPSSPPVFCAMILGFQPNFVAPIVAGTKVHCLREGERCQLGMQVHFYAYVRRVGMYPFRAPAPVVSLQAVQLVGRALLVDGRPLRAAQLRTLALAEGFADADALLDFLAGRPRPFSGQLIHWSGLRY